MFTSIAPTFAVANCITVHSYRLMDHIPTLSPFSMPMDSIARAQIFTWSKSSLYVHRIFCWETINAGLLGYKKAVSSSLSPMVWPNKGSLLTPQT